jgi:hypothetical protein
MRKVIVLVLIAITANVCFAKEASLQESIQILRYGKVAVVPGGKLYHPKGYTISVSNTELYMRYKDKILIDCTVYKVSDYTAPFLSDQIKKADQKRRELDRKYKSYKKKYDKLNSKASRNGRISYSKSMLVYEHKMDDIESEKANLQAQIREMKADKRQMKLDITSLIKEYSEAFEQEKKLTKKDFKNRIRNMF